MGWGGVKRDKYDIVFSGLIRERADYVCESCHKSYRHDTGYMDCAHVHSRKHQATRYHKDGAIALCKPCHRRFTDYPLEWGDFVRKYYGDGLTDEIKRLAHSIKKWAPGEKDLMYKHYRDELKRLEYLRRTGSTGRLEFVGWE